MKLFNLDWYRQTRTHSCILVLPIVCTDENVTIRVSLTAALTKNLKPKLTEIRA